MTTRRTLGHGFDATRRTDAPTPVPAPDRIPRTAAGLTVLAEPTHPASTASAASTEPTHPASVTARPFADRYAEIITTGSGELLHDEVPRFFDALRADDAQRRRTLFRARVEEAEPPTP
ncbi:hypothetical protein Kpho02_76300 [Kitasatospora phosalacinea]|uniref:Uncharacterized protein n=1 Tax=Kitasatospora phosalacinea TaxID=2065 RepID=A0A9W6V6I6_9ACTN|nr:hypothetical protein [Kitasatospora phosalacinea]GLW75333.1 hypothetical protein Kpho02_76300 [Kitasatospora phosalacinea]